MELTEYGKAAQALFLEGYNCSQAVCGAFASVCGLSREEMMRLASPFGGGFGRQREVCGSVLGAGLVLGFLCGTSLPGREERGEVYRRVQEFSARFREVRGSIVCREILKGLAAENRTTPLPDERDADYYRRRPCLATVGEAASILEIYLKEEGILP